MLKKFHHPDEPPPGGPPNPPPEAPAPEPVIEEVEDQTPPETPISSGVDGLNNRVEAAETSLKELLSWRDTLTAEREAEKAAHRKTLEEKTHGKTKEKPADEPKPRTGFRRLRFLRGTRGK